VTANAHLWVVDDSRFVASHPDSRHIVFRFPDSYPQSHLGASYTELWDDWAALLTPVIAAVGERYGFVEWGTSKIMLSSLRAHGQLPPHVDSNPSSLVPHKVHVPLVTNPGVTFVIEGKRYQLPAGRGYEINNLLIHAVENAGDVDRVHLIFEIYPVPAAATGAAG
jgi:hypothetical protein